MGGTLLGGKHLTRSFAGTTHVSGLPVPDQGKQRGVTEDAGHVG